MAGRDTGLTGARPLKIRSARGAHTIIVIQEIASTNFDSSNFGFGGRAANYAARNLIKFSRSLHGRQPWLTSPSYLHKTNTFRDRITTCYRIYVRNHRYCAYSLTRRTYEWI